MTVIGAIRAFQEADKIAGAVRSLFEVGCERVVVLDGAFLLPNGRPFGDGGILSSDGTLDIARAAGAEVQIPYEPMYGDAGKRDLQLRCLKAQHGDRVLVLDADERAYGEIREIPHGHAVVMCRNDMKPNDLPGVRLEFPRGDYGPRVPLIRWFKWSEELRCVGKGRYVDAFGPIRPYLRPVPDGATPEEACALPILRNVGILHCIVPSAERLVAKRAYYAEAREP